MITRRKLLQFLGLSTAAATVAREAVAQLPGDAITGNGAGTALPAFDMLTERTADGVGRVEARARGAIESIEPDGKAWARVGGDGEPLNYALGGKPVGDDWRPMRKGDHGLQHYPLRRPIATPAGITYALFDPIGVLPRATKKSEER